MRFEGVPGEGGDRTIYRVTDVLDGNHPYAGMGVKFTCKVNDVRRATASEIAQGAAASPGAVTLRIDG
jgi:FKBP-type peptidyl-prolyl cis-trans isomerase SlyD